MHPPEPVIAMDYEERMKVKLDEKELKKYPLGTKVRIVAEGVVKELRAKEEYESPCGSCDDGEKEKHVIPPCMYVEVSSKKVSPASSKQIDEIVESDEAEADYD